MNSDLMSNSYNTESEQESSEDELLRRLRSNDERVWPELYPIIKKQSMSVLLGMSIAGEDAEEIANDSILEVLRCDCYNDLSSLDELFRFVRSLSKFRGLDWFARSNSQKRGGGKVDSLDEPVGDNGQTRGEKFIPEVKGMDANEKFDILGYLRGCLEESLSERDSFLVRKSFLEEWKHTEIAEKLGFNTKVIGVMIRRSLDKLSRCMTKKGVNSSF